MNVLKEIEKGIKNCEVILENNLPNAKEYKKEYRDEIEVMIQTNEAYIDFKTVELQNWCDASATVWDISQDNILMRIKISILMSIANHHISKISGEMARAGQARDHLEKLKQRFDGFIYLT